MSLDTPGWKEALHGEKESAHFQSIYQFLNEEHKAKRLTYPPKSQIFAALQATPLAQVKVVILGQDPYHGEGQAHGLCFSVNKGVAIPPSLQNIFKEIESDLGIKKPHHGNLEYWAKQGVLLLNTVLTVRAGEAQSHQGRGWEQFTDRIIQEVNNRQAHVVFLLWGRPAQNKMRMIDAEKHTILTAPHPSPLSAHRGFLGCKHFSKTNAALTAHQQGTIDWSVDAH